MHGGALRAARPTPSRTSRGDGIVTRPSSPRNLQPLGWRLGYRSNRIDARLGRLGLDLDTHGVRLRYPVGGGGDVPILAIDRLRVGPGETVGIGGPSGSGKTSLLYVLTGVQRPQQGRVAWDGRDIVALPEGACDRWRRRSVGCYRRGSATASPPPRRFEPEA